MSETKYQEAVSVFSDCLKLLKDYKKFLEGKLSEAKKNNEEHYIGYYDCKIIQASRTIDTLEEYFPKEEEDKEEDPEYRTLAQDMADDRVVQMATGHAE